ncbi:tyrosine-type recombinase/integrase [Deinococcus sp.]|uniref:tyrosine-type recombinase/integrase n=1 Tax=Deinococcus sp. TaxID=47478 RepID=UPI0025F8487C|nr:tyrosine-type recombinase/integrase [Deinococcus sp.]
MSETGEGVNSGFELVSFTGQPLDRARQWTDLSSEELRRRAVTACRDRDLESLWGLAEAYFTTYGASGARASSNTLKAYRKGLKIFLNYADTSALNLMRPARDTGPTFLRWREAAGKSPATVRLELAAARLLYKALRWAEATTADPFGDARPARDKTAPWDKRQPYSEDELQTLLGHARPDTRAMLLLGAHAGLRVSEMLSLIWSDLDFGSHAVRVRSGKGGKARSAVMSGTLAQALRQLGPKIPDQRLFPLTDAAVRKRLRLLCLKTGVPYRAVHALRHYSGTRLYKASNDLEAVARHLGHSTLETTRIYAKWSDESLKNSVGKW